MDFRRVFLTYLEAPNSILAKNPKIGRILLNLPIFPLSPCLGFCAGVIIFPQTVLALRGSHGVGIEGAMAGARIRSWTPPLIFVAIYSTW